MKLRIAIAAGLVAMVAPAQDLSSAVENTHRVQAEAAERAIASDVGGPTAEDPQVQIARIQAEAQIRIAQIQAQAQADAIRRAARKEMAPAASLASADGL